MLTCRGSRSGEKVSFRPGFEPSTSYFIPRDEVHHSVCCLLVVSHLARLSRFCRGRPQPCSRRLPARLAAIVFFYQIAVPTSSVYLYVEEHTNLGVRMQKIQQGSRQVSCSCRLRSVFQIPDRALFSFRFSCRLPIFSLAPCLYYQCKNTYDDD